ncbi:MAG: GNAT family N-acetyltransferase [Anaerovoracaceae bacterium]|jgi:ribosomal protein S18 acetylase RimI-like enzyme
MDIREGYGCTEDVMALFGEYTESIIEADEKASDVLNAQNYEDEALHVNEKYGRPDGRLYIAYDGEVPAGCIALRRFDETRGEMKRLYVRPQYRGSGLGEKLARIILSDAREIGYDSVLLDSLPFMRSAQGLYRKLGFTETEPYYDSPMADVTTFMECRL